MAHDWQDIEPWLRAHPRWFAYESKNNALSIADLATSKIRTLRRDEVERVEIRHNQVDGTDYLVTLLMSGAQLVFAAQGFCWSPDFRNTGPLPLAPPVVCLRDVEHVLGAARTLSEDPDRRRDALDATMLVIAMLDGAAAVGLDVDKYSNETNQLLDSLERGVTR